MCIRLNESRNSNTSVMTEFCPLETERYDNFEYSEIVVNKYF